MTLVKSTGHKMNFYSWESLMNAINPPALSVEVTNGVVTLRGEVDLYAKKVAAVEVASRIHGVKEIICEIKVNVPEEEAKEDPEIEEQIVKLLVARRYQVEPGATKNDLAYWRVFE
jgi:hypothetical protein